MMIQCATQAAQKLDEQYIDTSRRRFNNEALARFTLYTKRLGDTRSETSQPENAAQVNRRAFLRRLLTVGVAATAVPTLLAACSAPTSAPVATTGAAAPVATTGAAA